MNPDALSIGELADAAGLSRRAVRFYVQQRLLPPPLGRGRGRHYDGSHLERLRRIGQLQSAGHSLDAIRRILDTAPSAGGGAAPVPPPEYPPRRPPRPALSAQLWTRLSFGDGVELHFAAARHNPTVDQLMLLREAVQAILSARPEEIGPEGIGPDDPGPDEASGDPI